MIQTSTRPVIAGIDGSPDSLRAAHLAAEEARRRQAPLRLVHVLSSPFRDVVTVARQPDLPTALRGGAADALHSLAAELSAVTGDGAGEVTWWVAEGGPVNVLRDMSAEAQLLVLGSRGVGGVAGLTLGSTASGVVAHSSCPVVVLPDDLSVTVSDRRSVVVGVEGSRGDDVVLAFAVEEAAALSTDLVAVHVWRESGLDPAYLSVGPLLDWEGVRDDEQRVLAEALAGWREKQPDLHVREVVLRDKTARGLLAAALTAQLLVVGHRPRSKVATLTSTIHGVLHRSACPVAVVPLAAQREG
ncbi:MAG: Universal stress protein family [Variovorax sp.]|nr:Universal stress protein family [Variovorax sp.]